MVELFLVVAVVLQAQVGIRHAVLRPGQLGRRQGQAGDLEPGTIGQFGKAAPAAADLQHALPLAGLQAVQDALVLGVLRRFQRAVVNVAVDGRRVTHARIEPLAVEGVAQVVVGHDVALAAGLAVAVQPVADAGGQQLAPGAVEGLLQHSAVVGEQGEQAGDVR